MATVEKKILVAGAYEPVAGLVIHELGQENMDIECIVDDDEKRPLSEGFTQPEHNYKNIVNADLSQFDGILIIFPNTKHRTKIFDLISAYKRSARKEKFVLLITSLINDDGAGSVFYSALQELMGLSGIPYSIMNVALTYQYLLSLICSIDQHPCVKLALGQRQIDLVDGWDVAAAAAKMLSGSESGHMVAMIGEALRSGEDIAVSLGFVLECDVKYEPTSATDTAAQLALTYPESEAAVELMFKYSKGHRLISSASLAVVQNTIPLRKFFQKEARNIVAGLGNYVKLEKKSSGGGWTDEKKLVDEFAGGTRSQASVKSGKRDSGYDKRNRSEQDGRKYTQKEIDSLFEMTRVTIEYFRNAERAEQGFQKKVDELTDQFDNLSGRNHGRRDSNQAKPTRDRSSGYRYSDGHRRYSGERSDGYRSSRDYDHDDRRVTRRESGYRRARSPRTTARDYQDVARTICILPDKHESGGIRDSGKKKSSFFQLLTQKNRDSAEKNANADSDTQFCDRYRPMPELDIVDRQTGRTVLIYPDERGRFSYGRREVGRIGRR